MQMVVFSWGRYIDVYHYEYEIVNCGFWNFRRHFECAIYLMTKFILIELCQAFRMTKTAGQSGTLSLEGGKKTKKTKKQTTFDVCLNTAFPLFFHRLIVKMLCLELLRASSCKLVTVGGLQIHEEHKLCVLKIRFYYYLLLFIYLEV